MDISQTSSCKFDPEIGKFRKTEPKISRNLAQGKMQDYEGGDGYMTLIGVFLEENFLEK